MAPTFADQAFVKQTVTYLDLTATAVLVYDYLLTVEREARLVWPVPWNVGKVLFFLTRYPVFADTFLVLYHQFAIMDPETCDVVYKTIGFLLGVGTLIAETILAVRTWVIWNRDPRVAVGLCVALVLFWVPVFFFDHEALYSLVFTTPPRPDLTGCFLLTQKDILYVVFILIMCFETLILALTLIKGFEHFRGTHSTLVGVLYRDGILNYVYLFILSVVNVVVLRTAPHGYSTLLTALQRVLHSVLSARILLHLREAAVMGWNNTAATERETNMSMDIGVFATPHGRRNRTNLSFQPGRGNVSTLSGDTTSGHTYFTEDKNADSEIWFGDPAEGELPETVTWFGGERVPQRDSGQGLGRAL